MSLLTNLAAFWSFDENSDGSSAVNRIDAHSGLVATDINTAPSVIGVRGRAVRFTKSETDRLSCADDGSLSITGEFTVSLWYRLHGSDPGLEPLLSKGGSALGEIDFYLHKLSGGELRLIFGDGSVHEVHTLGLPPRDAWQHLVFGRDLTSNVLWWQIDGGVRQTTPDHGPPGRSDPLQFGSFTTGSSAANVDLDLLGYWLRSLSPAEVSTLHASGAGLTYSEINPPAASDALSHFTLTY